MFFFWNVYQLLLHVYLICLLRLGAFLRNISSLAYQLSNISAQSNIILYSNSSEYYLFQISAVSISALSNISSLKYQLSQVSALSNVSFFNIGSLKYQLSKYQVSQISAHSNINSLRFQLSQVLNISSLKHQLSQIPPHLATFLIPSLSD